MKKGFTLIELLIVIAILAILATAVVLVLNPAQILAQARDSQRISDLGNVKSAIALYLATATSPTMIATTTETGSSTVTCPFTGACVGIVITSSTAVTGTGWVKVDLSGTSGGQTLGALPLDPTQSGAYFYAFKSTTSSTFKLAGVLESTKYLPEMSSDGGTQTGWFEVGTDLSL